jgi:hypothetical protein
VVEVYKDVPVERPIERVVEVVKEGTFFVAQTVRTVREPFFESCVVIWLTC